MPCPGFRDLADVIFRDETERVVQKARRSDEQTQAELPESMVLRGVVSALGDPSASGA